MGRIQSQLNVHSPAFLANAEHNQALAAVLRRRQQAARFFQAAARS